MDNNTNQNVDTNVKSEVTSAPLQPVAPATNTEITPPSPPVEEAKVETPSVQQVEEAPVQAQATEEKKEEVKTVIPEKPKDAPKEKPLKMKKKKGVLGTVFLLLILLAIIVLLSMVLMNMNKLKGIPNGVTDLNNIVIDNTEEVLYDSKLAIDSLDSNVKDAVMVYLIKHNDKSFKEYINDLPNSTKLYLASIKGKSSITLDTLKTNIKDVFGFEVTLEGENILADDKKTVLYSYDEKTGVFTNMNVKDKDYTPFKPNGEFLAMEYDDPTGELENSEVVVYGMVVVTSKEGNKFLNNKFTFIEGLSFDELKEKLPTLYGDQKENFDVIRYKLTKVNNKYILNDVKLN